MNPRILVVDDELQLRRIVGRSLRGHGYDTREAATGSEALATCAAFKPDVVVCQDPTTRWSAQGYINHPDHRAAGDAALDSVYPSARDALVFPELLCEGFEPHKVKEVYRFYTVSASNTAVGNIILENVVKSAKKPAARKKAAAKKAPAKKKSKSKSARKAA